MSFLRRLIAFLCIVAVLLAAMSPVASGLVPAILVPLLLCIAVVVLATVARKSDEVYFPALPILASLASRAPPSA
jgi:hypothetical protein